MNQARRDQVPRHLESREMAKTSGHDRGNIGGPSKAAFGASGHGTGAQSTACGDKPGRPESGYAAPSGIGPGGAGAPLHG